MSELDDEILALTENQQSLDEQILSLTEVEQAPEPEDLRGAGPLLGPLLSAIPGSRGPGNPSLRQEIAPGVTNMEAFLRTPEGMRQLARTEAEVGTAFATGGLPFLARGGLQALVSGGTTLGLGGSKGEAAGSSAFALAGEMIPTAGLASLRLGAKIGRRGFQMLREVPGLALDRVSTGRIAKLAGSIGRRSLIGRNIMEAADETAEGVARGQLDDVVQTITRGAGPEELGLLGRNAIKGGREAFETVGNEIFHTIDQLAPEGVNFRLIKKAAKIKKNQLLRGSKRGNRQAIADLNDILGRKDTMTFGNMQALRSDLLAITREQGEAIPGRAASVADEMASLIDEQMARTARQLGGGAEEAWRQANAFYKLGVDAFNNTVITTLQAIDSSGFSKVVRRNATPENIRRLKVAMLGPDDLRTVNQSVVAATKAGEELEGVALSKALQKIPNPPEFDQITGGVLEDIITQVRNQGARGPQRIAGLPKTAKGDTVDNIMERMGDTTLREMFGNNIEMVKDAVGMLARTQGSPSKGGALSLVIPNLEKTALFTGLASGFLRSPMGTAASALVGLTPTMLAQLVTSPKMVKLLESMLRASDAMGPFSRAATRASGQFLQELMRLGVNVVMLPNKNSEGPTIRGGTVAPIR